MELLRRLINNYITGSKKKKSEIIKQYAEISGISHATDQKRFKRYVKKYLNSKEQFCSRKPSRKTGSKKKIHMTASSNTEALLGTFWLYMCRKTSSNTFCLH